MNITYDLLSHTGSENVGLKVLISRITDVLLENNCLKETCSISTRVDGDDVILTETTASISTTERHRSPETFYRVFGFFIAYDLRGFSDVTWSCGPVKGSRAFIWVSPGGGFTTAGKNLRKGVVS